MKKERSQRKGIDWDDYLIRNLRWAWPFIFLFCLIIFGFIFILILNRISYNRTNTLIILSIMFIVCFTLLIYGLFLLIKTVWRVKRISFINYKRSLELISVCIFITILFLIGGWIYLMEVLEPDIDILIVAYIIQVLIFAFLLISIINLYYLGSIIDWYNNIIIKYGQEITNIQDGYTDRPYSMRLLKPATVKDWEGTLSKYGKCMSKQILIVGYEQIPNGFIFYLPSTSLMYGIVGSKRNIEKVTRITAYNDGTLSIFISKYDYDRIGLEITYHELCQRVLQAFADSIRSFVKGNEKEAIEILGGEDYISNRKKISRQRAFSYIRIATILTIINILLNIGIITQESTILSNEFRIKEPYRSPQPNGLLHTWFLIPQHALLGFVVGSGYREGDKFAVRYEANTSLPRVFIIAYRIKEWYDYIIISEIQYNVTTGVIFIETSSEYCEYKLVIDLWMDGYIIATEINFSIKHLNAYSPFNILAALFLISFYIPIEYTTWRKRERTPIA